MRLEGLDACPEKEGKRHERDEQTQQGPAIPVYLRTGGKPGVDAEPVQRGERIQLYGSGGDPGHDH